MQKEFTVLYFYVWQAFYVTGILSETDKTLIYIIHLLTFFLLLELQTSFSFFFIYTFMFFLSFLKALETTLTYQSTSQLYVVCIFFFCKTAALDL